MLLNQSSKSSPFFNSLVAFLLLLLAQYASAQDTDIATKSPQVRGEQKQLDSIAALVNDGVVLQSELDQEIKSITERLANSSTPMPPLDILNQQILERLVVQQIQLQRAARTGIQISDEALNDALGTIAQRNGVSLIQLPQMLAGEGINYAMFRKDIRKQMIIERLRQRDVLSRIAVSDREIANYLERESRENSTDYKLSHILISMPAGATSIEVSASEDSIIDIYEQLLDGADFAELAITYSNGQQALEGGSIGWRKGSELPTLFADVVPAMQAGDVSEPIRGGSGFHLIKLDELRGVNQTFQDQSQIRHILIKTSEIKDSDTAKQQLLEIRDQIVGGESFITVATAVSEDPGSAAKGGDLGWTGAGVFVPEFQAMADSLPIGELSEPFASPFGWHILEVTGRRTYDTTAEIQNRQAVMAIRNAKFEEETELWVRRIRDEAFVEYRL
jgi:peptidyl-prolyl cis-trans isomerase SurA